MESKIRFFALENAIKFKGKANTGAIIGKILSLNPDAKKDMKTLSKTINKIVSEINSMSFDEQKQAFEKTDKIKKPKIFGIATTPEMKKTLKNFKISQTQEGMITGVTGVLLYQGMLEKRDVLCLLAETQTKYPDSRAAAALLEKLDKMLPAIKIDPKPLYKAAKQIEDKILQSMEQSKPTAPSTQPAPYSMYR